MGIDSPPVTLEWLHIERRVLCPNDQNQTHTNRFLRGFLNRVRLRRNQIEQYSLGQALRESFFSQPTTVSMYLCSNC